MKNFEKYSKQYFAPKGVSMDWMHREAIEKPPVWCSVDMRDGNQSLDRADELRGKAGVLSAAVQGRL